MPGSARVCAISAGYAGVCPGMGEYARVCTTSAGYTDSAGCARVAPGLREYGAGYARVAPGVRGYRRVCARPQCFLFPGSLVAADAAAAVVWVSRSSCEAIGCQLLDIVLQDTEQGTLLSILIQSSPNTRTAMPAKPGKEPTTRQSVQPEVVYPMPAPLCAAKALPYSYCGSKGWSMQKLVYLTVRLHSIYLQVPIDATEEDLQV